MQKTENCDCTNQVFKALLKNMNHKTIQLNRIKYIFSKLPSDLNGCTDRLIVIIKKIHRIHVFKRHVQ